MPENWQKATKAPKVLKIKNSRNLNKFVNYLYHDNEWPRPLFLNRMLDFVYFH